MPAIFHYECALRIRITDINYGNHLANHAVLEIAHEGRVMFYAHYGFTELDIAGVGTVMSDAAIQFISEGFHGDLLRIQIAVADMSRVGFSLYYLFTKEDSREVCRIKTGIVCFDYTLRKVVNLPEAFKQKFA